MKATFISSRFLFSLALTLALASASTEPLRCIAAEPDGGFFLDRAKDPRFDVRVLNWNIWRSSVFAGVRKESFARIVRAVRPDLICLQEIDPENARDLAPLMDRLLPLENGLHWQSHFATNLDSVIASRYPLLRRTQEVAIPKPADRPNYFDRGHVMCVVDLPDARIATDLLVLNTHFQAGGGEANMRARQIHADAIIRQIRTHVRRNEAASLRPGTPFLLIGDFNVYQSDPEDPTLHLTTLLTGNIVDEATFGPDIKPDWDGTSLAEVKPRHNARDKDWYTWRSDSERFPPGALDRIIYSDSEMTVRHSFVLNTTTMTEEELARSKLLANDVLKGGQSGEFDHLPMVVDIIPAAPASQSARTSAPRQ